MKCLRSLLLILLLVFLAVPSEAGIYKYEDERGVIHFTNCPRDPQFKLYIRDSKEDPGVPGSRSASTYIKDTNYYDALITELCQKYQVDSALIKAIIRAESGFNPLAISRKGAKGLMQLMPQTARQHGVREVWSVLDNVRGGAAHLRQLLTRFSGRQALALAAYNAGEQAVLNAGSQIPPFDETQRYVPKVLAWQFQYEKVTGRSPARVDPVRRAVAPTAERRLASMQDTPRTIRLP